MNEIDDVELGTKLLPGVDLTLWMQIIVTVLFVILAAAVVLVVV
jgi:hypothetical protein